MNQSSRASKIEVVAASGPTSSVRLTVAILLAVLMLAWIVPELDRPGVTWDEPQYFASVERIQSWTARLVSDPTGALDPEVIRAAWDPPETRLFNPHPPVYKEGMAVTEALFGKALGPVAAYRLSPAILFAILIGVIAWTVSGVAGLSAGIGAALSLALMPRFFGHAHIAATDLPLSCFWTVSVLAFASRLRLGGGLRMLVAAVALGLALGTKFTGWLLPAPLLVWAILERNVVPWFVAVPAAIVVAWCLNPAAWHEPIVAFSSLVLESLTRPEYIPINTIYFGRIYGYLVPWHQAVAMTLTTVPIGILCLAVIGSFDALRNRTLLRPPDLRAALSRLSLLHILFFLALMGLPSSPNHDGVRLFLPMFPFLAILAGLALGRLEECLRTRLEPRRALIGALAIFSLYLLPPWWQGRHASPYYLSWYNELIGGLPGAANAGMEISYWYDALTPEFIAEVERVLPEGATVLAMPSLRYYRELQELGLMRADLRFGSDLDSSYLLMIARRTTLLSPFLEIYENVQPTLAVELDGVELAGLYALNEDRPTGEPGGGE